MNADEGAPASRDRGAGNARITPERRAALVTIAFAGAWLAGGLFTVRNLAFALPRAITAELSLPSYYALTSLCVSVLGALLAFRIVPRPREALALRLPRGGDLLLGGLVTPVVLVVSLYLAWRYALPTILAELASKGKEAVRESVSSANKAARLPNTATVVAWAVLVAPLSEELVIRGALWSGLSGLLRRGAVEAPTSLPAQFLVESPFTRAKRALGGELGAGLVATTLTALLFAWLHVESDGGAGKIAFAQTALVGLALGIARHATGTLAVPLSIHAGFNALTLAQKRGLVGKPFWPEPLPIPLALWKLAGVSFVLAGLVVVVRHLLRTPRLTPLEDAAPSSLGAPGSARSSAPPSSAEDAGEVE